MKKSSKPKDVDTYIADQAEETRSMLEEIRQLIKSTIPKAEETIS